jgi:hypothetical protein
MTDTWRAARWIGARPSLALAVPTISAISAVLAALAVLATPALVAAGDRSAFQGGVIYTDESHQFSGFQPNSGLFPGPYLPTGEATDRDGDGVRDDMDAFPLDPEESTDLDGDGIGDNADAFPLDPMRYADTDRDGIADSEDDCVGSYTMWQDEDTGSGGEPSCPGF